MAVVKKFQRALITGIGGSGGSYLAEYLVGLKSGPEVHGISRWHSAVRSNLEGVADRITVHECDLSDFGSVLTVLKKARPDVIFHLASHANVLASFKTPQAVLSNNIGGTTNLFEALRLLQGTIDPVVQLCSTSEVYGQVPWDLVPIREDCPIRPASPYAVSKAAQDLLGDVYFKSYGMKIIRTRMFAYLNPRREDLFASSFAKQVALIEAGRLKVLRHGNLDSVRTLIDVRDAMEAYWVAAVKCAPGEAYNIGGTMSLKVGEFLDILKKLSRKKIRTKTDPKLFRPADVTLQIPDTTKFFRQTGWKPKILFADSVKFLLEYWRERVRRGL